MKIRNVMKTISFLASLMMFFLCGCATSLVYSPSTNLTTSPLKKGAVDLNAGGEFMPESRPEQLSGAPVTFGLQGQINYGFSEQFNMSVKGWVAAEDRSSQVRSGYALSTQFIKPLDLDKSIIILPRIGMALYGNRISGYGVAASGIYQKKIKDKLAWHTGLGLAWGFKDLTKENNAKGDQKLPMGLGFLGHFGLGYQLSENFRLQAEINPVYQINTFNEEQQILASPSIGIGYTFSQKKGLNE